VQRDRQQRRNFELTSNDTFKYEENKVCNIDYSCVDILKIETACLSKKMLLICKKLHSIKLEKTIILGFA